MADRELVIGAGFTFVNQEAPGIPSHLWVVASDPDAAGRVLLVSISSQRGEIDIEVRFIKGDHPFISRPSFLRVDKVRVGQAAMVEEGLRKHVIVRSRDATAEMLSRAVQALRASRLVSAEAKALLR